MSLLSRATVVLALICFFLPLSKASAATVRQNGVKFMIVGDSISHGFEGAHTWRYRLWQWLRANNVPFEFVGPWLGTFEPPDPLPPQPPLLQGEPQPPSVDHVSGGYALDVDPAFDKHHFCHSGRQAAQVKNTIAAQVAAYQPDYVLVELGFNDLGWFVSGPDGLLSDMKTLIDNARSAKGNVKFAIANVPYRTRISGRQDLIDNTDRYNSMLDAAIPSWSTADSPVKLVRFRENYNCQLDSCPAAFDGLHPNQLGEYEIAQTFSRVLNTEYGFGSSALDVPANLPAPPCPVPANVQAVTAPYGVAVTWDKVYGSHGYRIRSKRSSFGDWTETFYSIQTNRYNQIWVLEGETWQYQIITDCGDTRKSDYSAVVSAVVHQTVAPGPKNIVVNPSPDGFSARWDPPDGNFNILLYEVFTYDIDQPCDFLLSRGIKGNTITVNGLTPGHRHIIAIGTWTDQGPGFPTLPWSVVPGAGIPATPHDLNVETRDGATVKLTWIGGGGAADYRAWVRNINNASDFLRADNTVVNAPCVGVAYLFPGVWNYEFCVSATNGNLESGKSNCVIGSRDISPTWSDCPTTVDNCGWGASGNGGDGSGQPGEIGGGSGGGSGGDGGGGGSSGGGNSGNGSASGDVYIDPAIWREPNPQVTCFPPCTIILPPTTLATPTTITLPPYTTDLEIVWTSNGKTTRSYQTTTIILPPITTQTISFWEQSFPPGPGFTYSPVPRLDPPPTTITNDQNPSVTRTITPSPYPTTTASNSNDDHHWGGPFPRIVIIIGFPGPICSGGCGSPCHGGICGGIGPCIPLLSCPRGPDFQDPTDPDQTNNDDDNDQRDQPPCPFGPQEVLPPVNPRPLGPDEHPDIHYDIYPGTSPNDGNNPGGGGGGGQPSPSLTPTPTPTPTPPPTSQRFWVYYVHYIDEINDYKEWQFFDIPTGNSWYICDTENAVVCADSDPNCRRAPEGVLTQPPQPNGAWTVTRGGANGCVYRGDGNGPGTLNCPNKAAITCKGAADTNPQEIDCPAIAFASDFYAAVYCDW